MFIVSPGINYEIESGNVIRVLWRIKTKLDKNMMCQIKQNKKKCCNA